MQIDETYWSKAKYWCDRWGKVIWIWGVIEVESGYCYLTRVEKSDVVTLISIINQHIKAKLYVVSDQWPNIMLLNGGIKTACVINTIIWMHLRGLIHKISKIYGIIWKNRITIFMEYLLKPGRNILMSSCFYKNKDIEFSEFLNIVLNYLFEVLFIYV